MTFAYDKTKKLQVRAEEVEKYDKNSLDFYYCIDCGAKLGLRKGTVKVHHFYHLEPTNCKGETALHLEAKQTLFNHLKENKKFSYKFSLLGHPVQLDLNIKEIYLEKKYDEFIPDILVIDENNNPVFFEIYVSSFSSMKKTSFLGGKVIEIKIEDDKDLEKLKDLDFKNLNMKYYDETKRREIEAKKKALKNQTKPNLTNTPIKEENIIQEVEQGYVPYYIKRMFEPIEIIEGKEIDLFFIEYYNKLADGQKTNIASIKVNDFKVEIKIRKFEGIDKLKKFLYTDLKKYVKENTIDVKSVKFLDL